MSLTWVSQTSLAATILASAYGTYLALSPPNPDRDSTPQAGDTIGRLKLTTPYFTRAAFAPCGALYFYTAALAYSHPNLPTTLLRHGKENGLNPSLITWSPSTTIPLALIFVGVRLRLRAYSTLDKNFTFALKKPTELTTTGVYRYMQHPSYTALVLLISGVLALLARLDGVLSCLASPAVYRVMQDWRVAIIPASSVVFLVGIWTRVKDEEKMLKAAFGAKWERWHAQTARFIPWLF